MTWVTWRQQRTEFVIAAAILALLAALIVPTGLHIASVYHHDGLASCAGSNGNDCRNALEAFGRRFDSLTNLFGWFNLIPGVIGVLLAAPFVLELESGTFRLAWTQSITRRRWLATKLGVTVLAALLVGAVMIALLTWWRGPLDHVHGRMGQDVFSFEGIVGFGYVLFALGLALAVGAVWRRTVPAVIVGFAGYIVARVFVLTWLRQRFEAPLTATWPMSRNGGSDLNTAWVLKEQPSDKFGHVLSERLPVIQGCARPVKGGLRLIDPSCLSGFTRAVYQPASRFWLFQGIETAIFGGVAIALIAFAAWWVHERVS
jgi:hypothetical protein